MVGLFSAQSTAFLQQAKQIVLSNALCKLAAKGGKATFADISSRAFFNARLEAMAISLLTAFALRTWVCFVVRNKKPLLSFLVRAVASLFFQIILHRQSRVCVYAGNPALSGTFCRRLLRLFAINDIIQETVHRVVRRVEKIYGGIL